MPAKQKSSQIKNPVKSTFPSSATILPVENSLQLKKEFLWIWTLPDASSKIAKSSSLVNLPNKLSLPTEQSRADTAFIGHAMFSKTFGFFFYSLKIVPIITVNYPVTISKMFSINLGFDAFVYGIEGSLILAHFSSAASLTTGLSSYSLLK